MLKGPPREEVAHHLQCQMLKGTLSKGESGISSSLLNVKGDFRGRNGISSSVSDVKGALKGSSGTSSSVLNVKGDSK